eukprot:5319368-Pyramimonas_sp.AAC.1
MQTAKASIHVYLNSPTGNVCVQCLRALPVEILTRVHRCVHEVVGHCVHVPGGPIDVGIDIPSWIPPSPFQREQLGADPPEHQLEFWSS